VTDGTSFVLDASALLALYNQEKGWEKVDHFISRGDTAVCMSAVNYAEVLSKVVARGENPDVITNEIQTLGIQIMDFDSTMAEEAGTLKPRVAAYGLSLGDCACLTLARHLDATALTADTAWKNLEHSFRIMLIR
jgi:PIN domain nuclease of toxin-antitoxin system